MFTSDTSREMVRDYRREHGDRATVEWLRLLGAPVTLIAQAMRDIGFTGTSATIKRWVLDMDRPGWKPSAK